jgi:hypothetical protein
VLYFRRRRFCFDPDFNTKLWIRQRAPKLYFCVMSVLGSCGRTSRLDVADPGKARREAAEVNNALNVKDIRQSSSRHLNKCIPKCVELQLYFLGCFDERC